MGERWVIVWQIVSDGAWCPVASVGGRGGLLSALRLLLDFVFEWLHGALELFGEVRVVD